MNAIINYPQKQENIRQLCIHMCVWRNVTQKLSISQYTRQFVETHLRPQNFNEPRKLSRTANEAEYK